ncbi:MAG: SRPBCC family protein [Candidatus Obscuribacterales bacterium]|nr:SRPBCC family protein [Candidatus Obscuribacterales bacterium]
MTFELVQESNNETLLSDARERLAAAAFMPEKEVQNGSEKTSEKLEENLHTVSREIDVKPDEIWKAIGKFDALPWHPAIQSGKVETKNNETFRTLVAKGGSPVFVEKLLEQGPNFIRYKMTDGLPLQPEATLKIEDNGRGGTRISWSARIDGADQKLVDAVSNGVMNFYAAGLDDLQRRYAKGK